MIRNAAKLAHRTCISEKCKTDLIAFFEVNTSLLWNQLQIVQKFTNGQNLATSTHTCEQHFLTISFSMPFFQLKSAVNRCNSYFNASATFSQSAFCMLFENHRTHENYEGLFEWKLYWWMPICQSYTTEYPWVKSYVFTEAGIWMKLRE